MALPGIGSVEISYKRPPITEAVIEFRFAQPLELSTVEKARDRFSKEFSTVAKLEQLEWQIGGDPVHPSVNTFTAGFRLHNADSSEIIIISAFTLSFSTVAPYKGWATFSDSAMKIYGRFRELVGYTQIFRIGLRYINRLDIPQTNPPSLIRLEDYIKIHPNYPEDVLPALGAFTVQCVFTLPEGNTTATISVASVASPLPTHFSILLDIDIGRVNDVPQKESEIREVLDVMRGQKNRIFEQCITDASRKTFNS